MTLQNRIPLERSVTEKKTDWPLIIVTMCLSVFGIIVIYSATRTLDTNTNVIVQSISFAIGIGLLVLLQRFDYEQFKNMIKPIYIISVLMLVAVLIFGITGDWGARSWIRIGAIGIQPSEFAKIIFFKNLFLSSFDGGGGYKQTSCHIRTDTSSVRTRAADYVSAGLGQYACVFVYVCVYAVCGKAFVEIYRSGGFGRRDFTAVYI